MLKKMSQKGLALLLALVFCFTLVPTTFAEDAEEGSEAEPAAELLQSDEDGEESYEPEDGELAEVIHEHDYTAVVTEPTCTEQGYTTYFCDCGDSYVEDYTDALGHSPKAVEEIPAAVGQEGVSAGVVCAVCGEVLEGCESIAALTEEAFTPEEAKTTGEEPEEKVSVAEESAADPTGEETAAEEAELQKPIAEGQPVEEFEQQEVEIAEEIEALPHEHDYTAVVTEPTCTEQGYTTYTCECGESYVADYTEPLNHLEVIDIPEVPATETEAGKTAGKKCALCGEVLEGCEEIPELEEIVISITEQPENTTPVDGQVEFKVAATVNHGLELQYQWQKLDTDITYTDEVSREAAWEIVENGTSNTMTITGLDEEETLAATTKYVYRCVLSAGEIKEKTAEVKLLVPLMAEGSDTTAKEAMDGGGASGTCGANLTWTLDDQGVLTISGTGPMNRYTGWDGLHDQIGQVIIGSGVTSITEKAFSACHSLTDVTMPNSVTSIGQSAFYGCNRLRTITFSQSVTSIASGTFGGCSSLTSFMVPEGVTSIGAGAFSNCSSLKNISIPFGITSIESNAFYGCSSLTGILLPNSVTSIDNYAFANCSSLLTMTVPNKVTSIGGGGICQLQQLDWHQYS